jgi:hypothetical protein
LSSRSIASRETPSIAEGRDLHRHDVEAVVEVFSELTRADHRLEVAVGGRDHAHVDLDRPDPADPLEALLLEDAQQLDLGRARKIADLVEEQRPAVRQLESPALLPVGPSEGPPLVAEELRLEERLR